MDKRSNGPAYYEESYDIICGFFYMAIYLISQPGVFLYGLPSYWISQAGFEEPKLTFITAWPHKHPHFIGSILRIYLGYTLGIFWVYWGYIWTILELYWSYTGDIWYLGYRNWFKEYTFLYFIVFMNSINILNLLTNTSFRIGVPSILFSYKIGKNRKWKIYHFMP